MMTTTTTPTEAHGPTRVPTVWTRRLQLFTTDGGGGLVALILLGFLIRYRKAWAYR